MKSTGKSMPRRNDTLVVIPAYNEAQTIGDILRRTLPFADVCVVNDASRDNTPDVVKSFPSVTLINHAQNTHIPQTLRDGMQYAVSAGYRYIITMDAGLTHKPEELPRFLECPDCDLVLGMRTERQNVPWFRKVISRVATLLLNRALKPWGSDLPRPRLRDATSGYRRYSRRAVELLLNREMQAKTFDFHTEALMLVYRNGLSIREVPISYDFSNSSFNYKVLMNGLRMFLDIAFTSRK
jgi:dolichol-phosphate mannosyltransferase